MKKLIGIMLVVMFLSGCASNTPKNVYIPITEKQPTIQIPPKPMLPIAKLKKNSKPNEVIKAYAASVEILQGYSNQLIEILRAYGQ